MGVVIHGGRVLMVVGGWGGGRARRDWSSNVFCLASPETISPPGRFVLKGRLKVMLSQEG